MDLLRQIRALLRSVSTFSEMKVMDDPPTASVPSWAVSYRGRRRSGAGFRDICSVHLFAGPAYRPDIEDYIANFVLFVSELLLNENLLVGDAFRDDERGWAQVSIEVTEP